VSRSMEAADHRGWARTFDAGSRLWEREVAGWVRDGAWRHHKRGDAQTTLFAEATSPDRIVGFISLSACLLDCSPQAPLVSILRATGLPQPARPDEIAGVHIVFLGVARGSQGRGIGTSIVADLLADLAEGRFLAPRFLLLEVWTDSPAIGLYRRLGFVPLGEPVRDRIGWGVDGAEANLQKMVLDRYSPVPGS
jgi:ribosomal protein S18 acetylase RimI-like enzyme